MSFANIMVFVTLEEGKLFYKELLKQRQGVLWKAQPIQAEAMEPLPVVPVGEALPPLNLSSKKVHREKDHKKSTFRHFDKFSSRKSHKWEYREVDVKPNSSQNNFLGRDRPLLSSFLTS